MIPFLYYINRIGLHLYSCMIRSCLGHTGNGVLFHRVRSLDGAQRISVDNYTSFGLQVRLSTSKEGTIKIEAKLDKGPYVGQINVINDVVIFEYEEVKWTAANYAEKAVLTVGQLGYSDWLTSENGYSKVVGDEKVDYDEYENRVDEGAAVVSTTAFRAIEGKSLKVLQVGKCQGTDAL